MPPRPLLPALLWLALATLPLLFLLLWQLRGDGAPPAFDAALVINALLLPLPPCCLLAWHRAAREAAAARRHLLDRIADAASRGPLELVRDTLDLARIEAGELRIEARPLRLEDVVAQAIDLVRPLHASAEVALVCDWADASLLGARGQLLGDAARLRQVVARLLSNALRFTPAGEVLLRLAAHPSDDQGRVPLCITVQDSGGGMTAGQPGNQPGNRGLTRRLVALMGGTLDVQSQPGSGSSVEIRLALPPDPEARPPAPPPPRRLLVASAHAGSREATLALLRHLGLGAGLAACGDGAALPAALAKSARAGQPFDWLLLDGRLHDADMLAQLRREHPALRIALCGPTGPGLGAHLHCPQPLLPGELRRLLAGDAQPPADAAPPPVLDLRLGLRRFDGHAALYHRTLRGFADQYADGLAAWPGWLARGDWAELRRAAHTLQGLAATVGAQPLHEIALALERAAANDDGPQAGPLLAQARAGLTLLQAEIQAALRAPARTAAPRAGTPGDLDELRQLLAQSDSGTLDWWQANGATCSLDAAQRQRLDEALAALDFDAAALALGQADSHAPTLREQRESTILAAPRGQMQNAPKP